MQKTRKSVQKRIKVTSSGKLLHRVARKNHFNAKKRRATQLRGQGFRPIEKAHEKNVWTSLPRG